MNQSPPAEDRDLLDRLSRGDVQALGGLYDRYAAPVYHLALAQTGDAEEAQDLLQETFLALWERGAAAARIRAPRAYLLSVAHRLATRRRGRRTREALPLEDPPGETGDGLGDLRVQQALTALPPEQAAVVALKVWHDLTFAEIGAALRISPHTAASRYRYGLDKLRQTLGDEDNA
jgi:RNA polymerase sigma-70 factor (ECF subfamily)